MRKPTMIQLGIASAAIIAVTGLAACAGAQSPISTSTSTTSTTIPATAGTTAATTTAISQADAERVALAAVPGSRVTETRLETDRGRTVWNVHLSTPNGSIEIKVDAQTGTIVADGQPSTTASRSDDGPGHS
jgi:uncharacterized membrane protein YkoI